MLRSAWSCVLFVFLGCSAGTATMPAPRAAPASPAFDRGIEARSIAHELDDLHDAAAHADETRYFGHFASNGVFLGTDATERWDLAAFRAFAHPHFASGKGWTYRVVRRSVDFARAGDTAWFDEDLVGEKAGACRGSGVLVRQEGRWLVAQYNLSFTIPNDKFAAMRAAVDGAPPAAERAGAESGRK